jgi:hypothetical protein
MIKRAALPAVAFLIIANFLGYAVVGSNGILSLGDYRRMKAERAVELAQLEEQKTRLARRAQLRVGRARSITCFARPVRVGLVARPIVCRHRAANPLYRQGGS